MESIYLAYKNIWFLYSIYMFGVWELYCNYMGALLFYSENTRKSENNPKHKYITLLSQVNICSIKQVILKENKENLSKCR